MLRLMIVDDEQIIRETLSEIIDYKSIGYQLIGTARNGMEAYDIICDEYPDVVITDIRMPILSGLELIERSMKSDSKITFILLSGYSEFEYAKQAMQYGVRHYLLKPTDKQELINTLKTIYQEHYQQKKLEQENRHRLLCQIRSPLEQCFLMEALENQEHFTDVFKKYQSLLAFPAAGTAACICSFVEKPYLQLFAAEVTRFWNDRGITLCFPIIYTENSALIVFSAHNIHFQEEAQSFLESRHFPGQSVSFDCRFLLADSTENLFYKIIVKISRFERILMIHNPEDSYEIQNHFAFPQRVRQIKDFLCQPCDEDQLADALDCAFTDKLPLETSRNQALGLFLEINPGSTNHSLDIAGDFFKRLYTCTSNAQIRQLMHVVLLQSNTKSGPAKPNTNISLLKAYVDQHLDCENLSLKWLSQNYLFVSTGYLSKLFVKEEGKRFSDYLNQRRMEEAERLMVYYHNDNIKNIARQVGFGSNPQYFSQVFKRYAGCTPTEYIEQLKNNLNKGRKEREDIL